MIDARTDEQLLSAVGDEPAAFGVFYERHEDLVLVDLLKRTSSAELAADLTAETFAQALGSAHRFTVGAAPAAAWLIGIARHVLLASWRRGRVEDRARRQLGMQPVVLDDGDLQRIVDAGSEASLMGLVSLLPQGQRHAVWARVVEEREYVDIARELRCSQSVVRKRVSRGLQGLRTQLEERT